jgi:hypothetical protein
MNLAPNGKPSNLTPEQYRLVRTPEFISWFGDWINSPETASKVVDENGEPLAVYHSGEIKNIFFEEEKYKNHVLYFSKGDFWGDTRKENLLVAFLRITNPYKFEFDGIYRNNKGEKMYYDENDKPTTIPDLDTSGDVLNIISLPYIDIVSDDLRKRGFDGSFYDDFEEIIILYPNQIKLADGSNTTFDGNNPDIRYADGGSINDFTYSIGGL